VSKRDESEVEEGRSKGLMLFGSTAAAVVLVKARGEEPCGWDEGVWGTLGVEGVETLGEKGLELREV
jgi:hypothetical protein